MKIVQLLYYIILFYFILFYIRPILNRITSRN